jgi:anti-sigma B factor antagonist
MDLDMQSGTRGDWAILTVKGEIDLHTAPQLKERLGAISDEGAQKVLVDMSDVGFMDSSGLGVLVGALKRVRERGGELSLVCSEGTVLKVLSLTGLDQVISVHGSVAEATGS